jgi:hypothetical protein
MLMTVHLQFITIIVKTGKYFMPGKIKIKLWVKKWLYKIASKLYMK